MGKLSRAKIPPSKSMSRKEKRKAERKLKKARRDAFAHRDFSLINTLKNVDTAHKAQCQKERTERLQLKKKKKKVEKKEVNKKEEDARVQGLKLAIQKDEKELKQLEKNLKFRKKKGKTTLPSSFVNDGLDYILDATDSEKIKTFGDVTTGYDQASDSETETDTDIEGMLEESEPDSDHHDWDPTAKASKSILKVSKKTEDKKKKNVKFQEENDEQSSENLSDDSDIVEEEEDNFDDDEGEDDMEDDEGEDDMEDDEGEDDMEDEENEDDNDGDEDNTDTPSKKRKLDSELELKEDIYGRLRDKKGNIVKAEPTGAYIPPAKRALLAAGKGNEQLHKKLKGLINKVSEGTIQAISSQVESLYLEHSRADVNNTMSALIVDAVVGPVLSPERLVAEIAMLVAILHSNVGSEIGAYFIQKLCTMFDENLREPNYGNGKIMENVVLLISNIYNFRIVHPKLIFDIMEKLIESFTERDIELILFLLKSVGFSLRKDDPLRLKQVILDIQTKARASESSAGEGMQARIRFMLDVLMAVRNNNMRKIPSYDPTHIEHLRKIIKNFLKGQGLGEDQLTIGLEDLLKADQVGRWWIVGSAWEGRSNKDVVKEAKSKTETNFTGTISKQMLKLAKQQGMNTDIRKHIFCILGTSEDYEDAFARLLRLGLNRTQEREIIHVLLHCCLNEKEYNPFYSYLAQKFCTFDRRFTMTVQFSMWDKFKEMDNMDKSSRTKLAHLLSHLLLSKGLSLSILKVVEFGMETKKMIRFLTQVLTEVLSSPNETTVMEIFERIAPFPKLKPLRQGLQVFMRINLKGKKSDETKASQLQLQERIEKAESAMFSHQTSHALL